MNCYLRTLYTYKEILDNKLYRISILSQTSPSFYVSEVQVFRKLCGKGEIARNDSVFYPSGELSTISIIFIIFGCKLFQFGKV